MFDFLRNCQIVFLSGCIILQSHQHCIRVPFAPYVNYTSIKLEKNGVHVIWSGEGIDWCGLSQSDVYRM